MTSRRRKPKTQGDPHPLPPPAVEPAEPSWLRLVYQVAIPALLGVWLCVWVTQILYDGGQTDRSHPRWHLLFSLFFLPDEIFAAWTDGVVSWRGLVDRLRVLMIVTAVTLPGWLLGRQLLRVSGIARRLRGLEIAILGLAIGLSLQATATLMLGLAGWVSYRAAMPMLGAIQIVIALALGAHRSIGRDQICDVCRQLARPAGEHPLAVGLTLTGIALVAIRCLLPSNEFDVLEYHLGAPKQWFQEGRIGFSEQNIYANMPMAAEMQTLAAMSWAGALGVEDAWWWGGLAGKSTMFLYWIVAIGATACLARRWVGGQAACWLVAVGCSGLAFAEVTVLGLIEPAVACYFAAALLALAALRRQLATQPAAMFWVGFLAGSALACKYPALLFVCLPVGLLATWQVFRQRSTVPIDLRVLGMFVLGCAITAGPWLAKNAVLAHNPVYPLAAGLLGGNQFSEAKMAQWQAAHAVPTRSLSALADSLFSIAWSWKSQGAILIPLALIGLLRFKRSPAVRITAAIAIFVFAVWWLLTHHLERFLLPAIPLAMLLAGFGIRTMFQHLGRPLASICLTVGILCNLVLMAVSPTMGDPRLLVDTSVIRREGIEPTDSIRIPEHVLWANRNLQSSDGVLLLVGDAAIFNYEVPLRYSTCFNVSDLSEIARLPADQWREEFEQRGIRHVLVHWGEIERYRGEGNYGFDPSITRELIRAMVDQGVLKPLDAGLDPQRVEVLAVGP